MPDGKELEKEVSLDLTEGQDSARHVNLPVRVLHRIGSIFTRKNKDQTPTGQERVIFKSSELKVPDELRSNFSQLIEPYYIRIHTYMSYRFEKKDAEDLTQQVFLNAWRAFPNYKPSYKQKPGSPSPELAWLYRIAHNLSANAVRDRNRETAGLERYASEIMPAQFSLPAEPSDEQIILRRIMDQLSPEDYLMLYLKHSEGFSNTEIGYSLGVSASAVRSRYHRLLEKIREQIPEDVYNRWSKK